MQEKLNIVSNCINFRDLPDIEIILNRRQSYKDKKLVVDKIVLRPEDYVIDGKKIKNNLDLQGDKDFSDLFSNNKEECQPAFMPIDVPAPRGPIFVFGEYFLRKFYTVFDRDENVLGFAHANHSSEDNIIIKNIVTPYDDTENELEKMEKENKAKIQDEIKEKLSSKNNENKDEKIEISIPAFPAVKITKKGGSNFNSGNDYFNLAINGAVKAKSNEESEFFKDVLYDAAQNASQDKPEEKSFLDEFNTESFNDVNNFMEP
jgi:hypothetical protein